MKKLLSLAGLMTIAAMAIGTSGCGSSSSPTTTTTPPTTTLSYVSRPVSNYESPSLYTFSPTTGASAAVAISITTDVYTVAANSTATAVAYGYDNSSTDDIYYQTTSGSPLQLTTGADGAEPAFSPDGKTVAYQNCSGADCSIYTVGIDGTNNQAVYATAGYSQSFPTFSPDGSALCFYLEDDSSDDSIPAAHGARRPLRLIGRGNSKPHGNTPQDPSYSNGWYTMALSSPTPTLVYATNDWWGPSSFTTDGTKLLMTVCGLGPACNIYSISLDGTGLTPLTVSVDADDLSPIEYNGQIVFNRYDTADDVFDTYTMALDGSAQTLAIASPPTAFEFLNDTYFWEWY